MPLDEAYKVRITFIKQFPALHHPSPPNFKFPSKNSSSQNRIVIFQNRKKRATLKKSKVGEVKPTLVA